MKRTIEEVKYLMAFYQINRLPLFNKDNVFLGYVTKDLKYDTANAFRVFTKKEYAIETACEQIDSFIESAKRLNSKEPLKIEIIEVAYEKENTEEWEGTLDEIFEKIERINNKYRYCNGHYWKVKDKEFLVLFRLWQKIISESRSFKLFYGDGIVD